MGAQAEAYATMACVPVLRGSLALIALVKQQVGNQLYMSAPHATQ